MPACLRPGAVPRRSNPTPEARGGGQEENPMPWLRGQRRPYRSYPMLKVRKGGGEETPLIQGKEQRLCFAGAAVKSYPKSKVRETTIVWLQVNNREGAQLYP